MAKPIPVALRHQIVKRCQQGESIAQIARDLERPYDSIRNVWTLYRREGRIEPNYQNCGQFRKQASSRVVRAAIWLKRAHPTWGGRLIGTLIQQKWADEYIPHERTLQRWFRQAGVHQRPQGRKPRQRMKRGQAAHAVWEMDSKQAIGLADGETVSWLLISDEKSGAMLQGAVFPHPLCRRD
jgi:transposase